MKKFTNSRCSRPGLSVTTRSALAAALVFAHPLTKRLSSSMPVPSFASLPSQSHSIKFFAAVDDYLKAKKATANTQRAIEFGPDPIRWTGELRR